MRRNGQALVEFIIIFPLVIYFLLGIIDFAMILYNKNNLESKMEDVITMYENGDSNDEITTFINSDIDNVTYNVSVGDKYTTITLSKKENIITPGLDSVLGTPYYVKVERVILNE